MGKRGAAGPEGKTRREARAAARDRALAKLGAVARGLARAPRPPDPAPRPAAAVGPHEAPPSFAALATDAEPLPAPRRGRVPPGPPARPGPVVCAEDVLEAEAAGPRAHETGEPAPEFDVTTADGFVEGRRLGVPARALGELRRAPTDAELDLHGLSERLARRALVAFVRRAHAAGARVLLVVHGKGHHSSAGAVLATAAPTWLVSGPVAALVRAFSSADAARGGSGALLIRLGALRERR
ncbi:MAG: Smr/MutS family protein [Polyangiaceae bacterium]|nr:Smr/MutS family protein [Polyangiaceae bacterium]